MTSPRIQVSRATAQAAARWLLRLSDENVSAQERAACLCWRNADPEHEEAWQRAYQLQQKMGVLPKEISLPTLARQQRISRRQLINGIALLVAAGPAGYLGYRHLPWQGLVTEYHTGVGQQKSFQLVDGTLLHLNTDSWAAVEINAQTRRIRLHHGEIFVRTGKTHPQPLHVITGAGTLTPIGTAFNVRHIRDSDTTELRVSEGRVAVHAHQNPHTLEINAGQKVNLRADNIRRPVADPHPGGDWVKGVLRVENMPLATLTAELGRYRHGWLRCDPAVATLRVSGVFQLADTDQILRSLHHSLPVKVVYRTPYWVSILPAD